MPENESKTTERIRQNPIDRDQVFERDNYTCQICNESPEDERLLEVHHIVPLSEGGSDNLENLVTVCPNCHRKLEYSELKEELTEHINNTFQNSVQLQAIATDRATKTEILAGDAIDIIKINLLAGSLALPALSYFSQFSNASITALSNPLTITSGGFWLASLTTAVIAYILGRTRAYSAQAIKIQFEEGNGQEKELEKKTKKAYRRNIVLIVLSVLFMVFSIILLISGFGDALGTI